LGKTSVKITGVKELGASAIKVLRAGIENDEALTELGDVVKKNIVGNARTGKDSNGNPLKPLSKSWIDRKSQLAKANTPSAFYRKNKSNLTFTGQLLDSFTFRVVKSKLLLEFFFSGMRKPYRGLKKEALDGAKTNKELAAKLEEDRPILIVGDKTREILFNLVRRKLRQQLSNFKRLSKILR